MLTADLTYNLVVEPPRRNGWWMVQWPDARRTYLRCEGDAEELAERIRGTHGGCVAPRHVTTITEAQ